MNGVQVASLFGVLGLDDSDWNRKLRGAKQDTQTFSDRLDGLAGRARGMAGNLASVFGPLSLGLGAATRSAMRFDEAMTNTQAVLGASNEQMSALSANILDMGRSARAGPQRVAEAYYDIVGGVAEANSHMAILTASIATAEAGNADLAGVTKALIATMNGFELSADGATRASDVLTRTVGVGVGTMDELATALPDVAGLAKSMGVSLEDTGAILGFLSTKGNTFNQSATQMRQMMVALLNPNEKMKNALEEMGWASGQAAVEQYGLAGAFMQMSQHSPTFQQNMAGVLGSVEALSGVTSLLGEGAASFLGNFTNGLEGATAAAREIQNQSPAAQWDLFLSKLQATAITLGSALIPALNNTMTALMPVVDSIAGWIQQNPELAGGIGMLIVGAGILSPVLFAIGSGLSLASTLALGLTGAITLLTNSTWISTAASWAIRTAWAAATVVAGLFGVQIGWMSGLTAVFTTATGLATTATSLFSGAMAFLAGPGGVLLAVVGLITGALVLLEEKFQFVTKAMQGFAYLYESIFDPSAAARRGSAEQFYAQYPHLQPPPDEQGPVQRPIPGHRNGLAMVPHDNYFALLHKEEAVLTAEENRQYRAGRGGGGGAEMIFGPGSVVINANTAEGGRQAADGFQRRMTELRRSRGVKA